MGIETVYVCDNVLTTKHYHPFDKDNFIRVEQTIQQMVSRPMIFCSPECAAQYVAAWLATRVMLDKATVDGEAEVEGIDEHLLPADFDTVAGAAEIDSDDLYGHDDTADVDALAEPLGEDTLDATDEDAVTSLADVIGDDVADAADEDTTAGTADPSADETTETTDTNPDEVP